MEKILLIRFLKFIMDVHTDTYGNLQICTEGDKMDPTIENIAEKFIETDPKKFILRWGNGDGTTWHEYYTTPFETVDVITWEMELLEAMDNHKEHDLSFKGIELPVLSSEFSYEIIPFDVWWSNNKMID